MIEFSLGQCRVRLHFLFLAAFGVVLFTDLRSTALWGMLAAVIHEGGHLLLMQCCRVRPASVEISAFGVLITEQSGRPKCCMQEVLVSLGGPLANGAVVCILILCSTQKTEWSAFFLANASLGLFNLLPVESLDGGRALLSVLSRYCLPARAVRVCFALSLLFLVPLAVLGFMLLFRSKYNFSLLAAVLYLFLCLLCKK